MLVKIVTFRTNERRFRSIQMWPREYSTVRNRVTAVTKSEITYQGQLVATTESVLRDDSPTFKIDALYERLDAASKKIKEDVGLGKLSKDLVKSCEDAKQGIRPAVGHS